ncbi:MAG TPA: NifB/NifX family molybdenum-iron cluster-binding protein [Candidatus Sulfotelmatobacter sp.]|nr:NifB/NifX family molybdenum-iron cluster-binding protein [Candidatus Sulfotelmatobacter sp.]
MKIAVTVQGPGGLEAPVDVRFARAAGFLIVETETGQSEYLDNWPAAAAPRGAGRQAVRQIADRGVRVLLTGRCGPNASRALQAAGIRVCTVSKGSAKDVVARFLDGGLNKTAA